MSATFIHTWLNDTSGFKGKTTHRSHHTNKRQHNAKQLWINNFDFKRSFKFYLSKKKCPSAGLHVLDLAVKHEHVGEKHLPFTSAKLKIFGAFKKTFHWGYESCSTT